MNRTITVALLLPFLGLVAAKHSAPAPAAAPHKAPASATQNPAVTKAAADLQEVEKRLRATFEQAEDYQKADAAVKQAQTDYEAAFKAAAEKAKDQPEFAAAIAAQKKIEDEQFALRSTPDAKPDPEAATKLMDAKTAVHKLEIQAGDADPAAKDAKAKLQTAKDAMAVIRNKGEQTMHADPDYIAAKKALDDARAQAKHA